MRARFCSVYRPCDNKKGPLSVWNQHHTYLHTIDNDRNPRDALLEDLAVEVKKWIAEGDHVIIGGDFNENILGNRLTAFFRGLGMKNIVLSKHGALRAPPTCIKNQSHAVDGIWVTPGVIPTRCGYLDAGDLAESTDHRPIWFDVSFTSLLAHPLPPIARAQVRRLVLCNPFVTTRYQNRMKKLSTQHKIGPRQFRLEASL